MVSAKHRKGVEKSKKAKKPFKAQPRPAQAESAAPEKGKRVMEPLRGMRDLLPKDERYWKNFYHIAENLADYFQYGRLETPLLEPASLFIRSLGRGTDVIDKEMYIFEDRDGEKVCLRPEATASAVRAYIGDGLWNQSQPVKLWYWGPMFRHDRPQAGRYRQFYQAGYEILGALDPIMDAELILLACDFFKDAGLPVEVHVNSIGLPEERERYKSELLNYYRAKRGYLCEDCRKRLQKNPLRLLDCKQPQCQPIKDEAPQIIDWLSDNSKNYFMKVLEHLDELNVPYVLRPTLVRGLDYYTHTVFEIYTTAGEGGAQSALGGGGRYDLLAEELGGKPTSAAGLALGLDRAVIALKEYLEATHTSMPKPRCDLFFAQLGDRAKAKALKMIEETRGQGLRLGFNLCKNSLKSQLEQANEMKAPFTLILGQKEVQEGTIIIRDMESGNQEIVDQKKAVAAIKKKLEKI